MEMSLSFCFLLCGMELRNKAYPMGLLERFARGRAGPPHRRWEPGDHGELVEVGVLV